MKKIIKRLLPWVLVLAAIAALVIFVGIPIYTQTEEVHAYDPDILFYDQAFTDTLVLENDQLLFELDPQTTHFRVTDKTSGHVWLSNPEGAASDAVAIASNKEQMQSTLLLTYTTANGSTDMNNFKQSIQNQNYLIEQTDDEIRVRYAIGNIERVFQIPSAITKERFDNFTSQMKKSNKKRISGNYTLYEPEKLDTKPNKDEIIAMYPEVVNQPLYVLKADVSTSNKEKAEELFAEVGYTAEEFAIDQQLVAGAREEIFPVFNVTMVYRLEGNDLVVDVPYDEIRYRAEYPFTYLTVLPMFGAAGTEDEGYILVPEGGGALIRYNNGKVQQNAYYSNLYGWDYGMYRSELVNETRNAFPVFGMATGDNAFLCIIEGAPSYASIQADVSMRFNSYNTVRAKYNVLHFDQYNVSAKTTTLVYMYEDDLPKDLLTHRYRIMDTSDYVQLATEYGNYLRDKEEFAQQTASETVPVSMELVGGIDKTVVKFGLPVDSVVATTTFAQAQDIVLDMQESGVENLNVRMSGWMNGGVTQKVIKNVKVLRQLGGEKAMKDLISTANAKNVNLYFDGISCFAYDSGIFNGFVSYSDAARYTTREEIKIDEYDVVTFLPEDWLDSFYLVRPEYAKNRTETLINGLQKLGASGVAFRDIGYLLSADYNSRNLVTREQVLDMNVQSMKDARDAGQKVMIRYGNDYALPYADIITDMDLLGEKYTILDQNVPFYQIALHGLKDYTGESLNLCGDFEQELLRCAEYGAGLNFTFMAENTQILQDTFHSNYYGAYYDGWSEDVKATVNRYQEEMQGLNQQRIVLHEQVTQDVTVTGYEDGTKVYVNYGRAPYEADGVQIAARDYYVERGR